MAGLNSSLLEDFETGTTTTTVNRPRNVASKTFSSLVGDILLDFVLIKYSNRILIIVSESKKIGNFFSVQVNSPQTNGLYTRAPSIFDIKCILGAETEENTVAVRALAEKLRITQPVLLSLTISSFDFATISAISEAILANKCW